MCWHLLMFSWAQPMGKGGAQGMPLALLPYLSCHCPQEQAEKVLLGCIHLQDKDDCRVICATQHPSDTTVTRVMYTCIFKEVLSLTFVLREVCLSSFCSRLCLSRSDPGASARHLQRSQQSQYAVGLARLKLQSWPR